VSVDAAFRSFDERRELVLNAVRYGALSEHALKLALALIERYAPAGKSTASAVENGLRKDLERIPAEIVADQAIKLLKADQLFLTGRELEMASYNVALPPFDKLSVPAKSMLGALLDYAGIDRERFAQAWRAEEKAGSPTETSEVAAKDGAQQPTLFGDKQ
jgi:hypothetical protein